MFSTNDMLRLVVCVWAQERAMEEHRRWEIPGSFRNEQQVSKNVSSG